MEAKTLAPYRVGLDVDGVLANFTKGFLELLHELTGRKVPDGYVQAAWSEFGDYRESETRAAWVQIIERPFWWAALAPLDTDISVRTFLSALWSNPHLDVTFLTTRPGPTSRRQTITWLTRQGSWNPQVLVAKDDEDKGRLAAMLNLEFFCDDKWQNCNAVMRHVPGCHVTLYGQPWNEGIGGVGDRPLPRLNGLTELWSAIDRGIERRDQPTLSPGTTAQTAC